MLEDKDVAGVVRALAGAVDVWHVAGLAVERGAGAAQLAAQVRAVVGGHAVREYETVAAALAGAVAAAGSADRVVACGSFYTVAAALAPDNSAWWRTAGTAHGERLSAG
jgi:dihydrofolate synthase/folylpolyglutamate synthase